MTPGSCEQGLASRGPLGAGEGAATTYLESIRSAELSAVRSYFRTGMRVLEIGGGSGYQASVIASWGCHVEAIDLEDRPAQRRRYHPVRAYDGQHIPFGDGAFDMLFSSNVLEHIEDLPGLLGEARRVLTAGGGAVHIVPTPVWRLWSIAGYHPFVLRRLLGSRSIGCAEDVPTPREVMTRGGLGRLVRRALFPSPHGAYPSALAELFSYREARWRGVFHAGGFDVVECRPAGVFYTGYGFLPRLTPVVRGLLARVLGSASVVFVLKIRR